MPTPVLGARATTNVTQGLRKIDMSEKILLLQPDESPLTVLSKSLSKSPTHNPDFQWAEDDIDPRFSTVPSGATASATSFAVAAGTGTQTFKVNDIARFPRTGENILVTAVATDTLTVVRGVGQGGTGQTINAAEEILVLGSAKPEGDTSDPARTFNPSLVLNYTQIFRRPVEQTQTWIHSDMFVSDNDWAYQLNKAGIDHMKDIEEAFINGRASIDTTNSAKPRRTTAGALSYVASNVTAAGGVLSEASFFAALRPAFRYGSNTKTGLASGLLVDVLNGYPRSKVQVPDPSYTGTYGLRVMKYQSPHGNLNLVRHWLLEGVTLGGYLLVIDQSQLKYRFLANSNGSRDTHVNQNVQAPDADTRKDEYLTEAGLQFGLEKTHALITGVTG